MGQERVSRKIGHLVGQEKKDPKQAAAIAYSMEKRGELAEELAIPEEEKFREQISDFLSNLLAYMPELNSLETREKAEEADPIVASIMSQLSDIIEDAEEQGRELAADEEGEIEKELATETSGAGAVSGSPGAFGAHNSEREEKRNEQRRIA
jgi:hypothetical protein